MPQATQDPTQAAFDQSAQVPDVPASAKEKVFGVLKGLTVGSGTKQEPSQLEQAIEKHHQQRLDEARMHKRTASTALGIWAYGKDPKTGQPLTPEEEQRYLNEWNSAMEQFGKVAGVNKHTKAAIQQNKQIAEAMAQQQRKKNQPQQTGGPGGMPMPGGGPPPVPQAAQSASPDGTAGPQGGPPPPIPFADPSFKDVAPFMQARVVDEEGRRSKLMDDMAAFKQRGEMVKQIPGMDPNSLPAQEFMLTGKIGAGATRVGKFTQGPYMTDPDGVPRKVLLSPDGQYVDPVSRQPISDDWKFISASDLATKTVNLMTPDGPRMYFRNGNKLHDNDGKEIEGDLIPFQRGMLNTTTDREVAVYNPDTHAFEKMLFRSTRKVQGLGTSGTPPPAVPGEKSGAGAGGGKSGAGGPPAVPGAGAKGGGKRFIPASAVAGQNKVAAPIRQARTALIGDTPGEIGGLAGDLDVFKDPAAVKRISDYIALIDKVTESERHAASGQGPGAMLEWMVGMPQELVSLQQGALRDASAEMAKHPKDAKFIADYFRALGTIGGMRSATGANAAEWSYEILRKELPTPGRTNYEDAKRRILNYVHESNEAGVDNQLSAPVDVKHLESQLGGGKGAGGKGTVTFRVPGRPNPFAIPEDQVPEFLKDFPNAKRQ